MTISLAFLIGTFAFLVYELFMSKTARNLVRKLLVGLGLIRLPHHEYSYFSVAGYDTRGDPYVGEFLLQTNAPQFDLTVPGYKETVRNVTANELRRLNASGVDEMQAMSASARGRHRLQDEFTVTLTVYLANPDQIEKGKQVDLTTAGPCKFVSFDGAGHFLGGVIYGDFCRRLLQKWFDTQAPSLSSLA